ncbi:MAG TPA: Rne/Rng family ribonuclease, partial [Candidatus Baltobacteraceae bacterium]
MPTEILISSDPWENRVAILEDGTLAELYFEREERVIGSIYKGKVQNVLPGMGAAFIDIGLGRNAFLYVDDINKAPLNIGDVEITQGRTGWTINEKVNRGDDVLVQIVKEPRGLKGARVSTNISLPGRYLILMPTGKYSGVSRKIESVDERNRLKQIMKLIRPEGMATVVRTAAAGVSQAELIADLGVLIRMWHGILEQYKHAPAPSLIHKDMNLVYKAARDFITPQVDRVYIDDPEEYEKVRDFLRLLGPQYVDRIQLYSHGRALFKDYKIDEEVQRLLRPKINLPSGGSIVIESTEALTVIDVNSGKFTGGKNLEDTIVKTNIEAAAEIARQVRLRDIGGIIVCDFIDMSSESARNKVLTTLETGLRRDRTRTTIQSFSALGLLEFTRKRIGKDLSGQLRGKCPTCEGLGTVMSPESMAIDAFRDVRRVGHEHANGKSDKRVIAVTTAPLVGAQIEFWYETELEALEKETGAKVDLRV